MRQFLERVALTLILAGLVGVMFAVPASVLTHDFRWVLAGVPILLGVWLGAFLAILDLWGADEN